MKRCRRRARTSSGRRAIESTSIVPDCCDGFPGSSFSTKNKHGSKCTVVEAHRTSYKDRHGRYFGNRKVRFGIYDRGYIIYGTLSPASALHFLREIRMQTGCHWCHLKEKVHKVCNALRKMPFYKGKSCATRHL